VCNAEHEHASWNFAAHVTEPVSDDVELLALPVGIDHSQQCRVECKKKKHKSRHHSLTSGHSVEDHLSSGLNSRQSEGNTVRVCTEAIGQLTSSQNLETFAAAQNEMDNHTAFLSDPVEDTHMMLSNSEHLVQLHTAVVASESLDNSNMNVPLSSAESQANGNNLVSDVQQPKLSHSAKRRSRRHRVKKNDNRKDGGNLLNDRQGQNIAAVGGSSMQNVSSSNSPTLINHSLPSGTGRTHIIFDSVNSDDETNTNAHPTVSLTGDEHDIGDSVCNTVVASHAVSSHTDTGTLSQHVNTISSVTVPICADVGNESFVTHLQSQTKVHRPAKKSPFSNVQVYCRQRNKKSSSLLHDQATDMVTSSLSKQASI